jgi:hypothetical protein
LLSIDLFVDLLNPLTSAENVAVTLTPRSSASGSTPSHSYDIIRDVADDVRRCSSFPVESPSNRDHVNPFEMSGRRGCSRRTRVVCDSASQLLLLLLLQYVRAGEPSSVAHFRQGEPNELQTIPNGAGNCPLPVATAIVPHQHTAAVSRGCCSASLSSASSFARHDDSASRFTLLLLLAAASTIATTRLCRGLRNSATITNKTVARGQRSRARVLMSSCRFSCAPAPCCKIHEQ